jgi:hypothetical protein
MWAGLLWVQLHVDDTMAAVSAPCFLMNPDRHALSSRLHTSRAHTPGRGVVQTLLATSGKPNVAMGAMQRLIALDGT